MRADEHELDVGRRRAAEAVQHLDVRVAAADEKETLHGPSTSPAPSTISAPQSRDVLRTVDVPQCFELAPPPAERGEALPRLRDYGRSAPADVVEERSLRAPQTDQHVAAVLRRSKCRVIAGGKRLGRLAQVPGMRAGQSQPITIAAGAPASARSNAACIRSPRSPGPCSASVAPCVRASAARAGCEASGAQQSSTRPTPAAAAVASVRATSRSCSAAAPARPRAGMRRVFTSPGTGALAKTRIGVNRSRSVRRRRRRAQEIAQAQPPHQCQRAPRRRAAPSDGRTVTARLRTQSGGDTRSGASTGRCPPSDRWRDSRRGATNR